MKIGTIFYTPGHVDKGELRKEITKQFKIQVDENRIRYRYGRCPPKSLYPKFEAKSGKGASKYTVASLEPQNRMKIYRGFIV